MRPLAAAVLVAAGVSWPAFAAEPPDPCADSPSADCVLDHARALRAGETARPAVDYLKAHRDVAGADPRFVLQLAGAYLRRSDASMSNWNPSP